VWYSTRMSVSALQSGLVGFQSATAQLQLDAAIIARTSLTMSSPAAVVQIGGEFEAAIIDQKIASYLAAGNLGLIRQVNNNYERLVDILS
jgi:hypothetical protein